MGLSDKLSASATAEVPAAPANANPADAPAPSTVPADTKSVQPDNSPKHTLAPGEVPDEAPEGDEPPADDVPPPDKPKDEKKDLTPEQVLAEELAETHKVKINGKEYDVTTQELITFAQKAAAADQRFQEAAQIRSDMESLFTNLKENPFPILERLGINVREVAESYLYDLVQFEGLPEPERKRIEAERKLKTLEEQQAEQAKLAEEQQFEADTAKAMDAYSNQIIGALSKIPSLPKTEKVVQRIAAYMYDGVQQGIDVTAEQAAQLVQQDLTNEYKHLASTMTPEQLIEMFGDEVAGKILQHKKGKVTKPENRATPANQAPNRAPAKKQGKKSFSDFRSEIRKANGME
jgi:hypothetical protein